LDDLVNENMKLGDIRKSVNQLFLNGGIFRFKVSLGLIEHTSRFNQLAGHKFYFLNIWTGTESG